MAKIILICGKICSGKSYYASKLKDETYAVILSCDEFVQDIFPYNLGEQHDEIVARVKRYLHKKASEIAKAGTDVILEFGFWNSTERKSVSSFYMSLGIHVEWHYVDISDDDWIKNIKERNKLISEGKSTGYYVDKGLINKLTLQFEKPCEQEMDVWYTNRRV